jgi:hypothetical protein
LAWLSQIGGACRFVLEELLEELEWLPGLEKLLDELEWLPGLDKLLDELEWLPGLKLREFSSSLVRFGWGLYPLGS